MTSLDIKIWCLEIAIKNTIAIFQLIRLLKTTYRVTEAVHLILWKKLSNKINLQNKVFFWLNTHCTSSRPLVRYRKSLKSTPLRFLENEDGILPVMSSILFEWSEQVLGTSPGLMVMKHDVYTKGGAALSLLTIVLVFLQFFVRNSDFWKNGLDPNR